MADLNPEQAEVSGELPAIGGRSSWLWTHIGRLSGIVIGLLALGSLAFLAAIGFRPALLLLVFLIAGVAMLSIGARMRAS